MSVVLPWSWSSTRVLQITKLEANGFGGTSVEGTFDGEEFSPFSLLQDVDVVGADALKPDIENCVDEQIASAMRLAR